MEAAPDNNSPRRTRWPRFSLGTLMMVMLVCAVTATAASYLIRAVQTGTSFFAIFIIFTLAAPILLVIGLNLVRWVVTWFNRRGPGK